MTRIVARAIWAGMFLILTVGLLALPGCTEGDLEEAQQDAREAKKKVSTLEFSLAQDELQRQVDQLVPELDKARLLAGEAEQVIAKLSTRAKGQTSTTAALQKEIVDLKTLVADQAALIEELQKGSVEEPILTDGPPDDEPPVTDPNTNL